MGSPMQAFGEVAMHCDCTPLPVACSTGRLWLQPTTCTRAHLLHAACVLLGMLPGVALPVRCYARCQGCLVQAPAVPSCRLLRCLCCLSPR